MIKVAILQVFPCFFEGFYLIFAGNNNVLELCSYSDFNKTYYNAHIQCAN